MTCRLHLHCAYTRMRKELFKNLSDHHTNCLHGQDVEVQLADIVPPLANISPAVAAEMAQQPLIPLDVSGARQFFLSWRHGRLEVPCLH